MQIRIDLSAEKKFVTKTAAKVVEGIDTAKANIRHAFLYRTNAMYRLFHDVGTSLEAQIAEEEAFMPTI